MPAQGEAALSGGAAASTVAYPPASLEALLSGLFMHGGTGQAAWHTKLALLLYFCLDAALPVSLDAFRCAALQMGFCSSLLANMGTFP